MSFHPNEVQRRGRTASFLLVGAFTFLASAFFRTQILEHVWGYDFDPSTNIVDACIQRIRKKIDRNGASWIESVRGVGYRFRKPGSGA